MKIEKITGDYILFDDGTKITYYHEQDCCENVYADFEALNTTAILDENFNREDLLNMAGVKDYGIKLKSYIIPCYNIQNGYYSGDLELVIEKEGEPTVKINCLGFIKEEIV